MSVRFRASVRSTRTQSFGWAWVAAADDEDGTTRAIQYGYAKTQLAALAEAYTALFSIRRQLEDEIHADRAGRRYQRCAECGHLIQPGTEHVVLGVDPCIILEPTS